MTTPHKVIRVTVPSRPAMNEVATTAEERLRSYHELVRATVMLASGMAEEPRVERTVTRVERRVRST